MCNTYGKFRHYCCVFDLIQVFIISEELAGRHLNDWIMNTCIKRTSSVFEAESLWYRRLVLRSFVDWLTFDQDLLCHFASVRNCIKRDERCYPKSSHDQYGGGTCIWYSLLPQTSGISFVCEGDSQYDRISLVRWDYWPISPEHLEMRSFIKDWN